MFISLCAENEALAEARKLVEQGRTDLPLYGVPVAVKDNIDAWACRPLPPARPSPIRPGRDAVAVARLREAGAIIIGKTNLDQFATGLVGVRSPYGAPRNPLDPALIPGGSSSGSAVAVAAGLVPWRSAPIPRDRAACRRCSTTSSASSRASGLSPIAGWCRPAARSTACRCSR